MTTRRDAVDDIIRDLQSRDTSRIKIGIQKIASLTMVYGIDGLEREKVERRTQSVKTLSRRLLQLCGDDDRRTRCAAIRGLGELSYTRLDGESLNRIVHRLFGGLLDDDGRVRWAAVQTLERFLVSLPDEVYVETYWKLREMHGQQGGGVRRSIGQALGRMGGPRLHRMLEVMEYERMGVYTDELKESLALEDLIGAIRGLVEDIEKSPLRARLKLRSASISPDAPLDEVLARYTKNALEGMAKLLELPSPVTGLKKREMVEKIGSYLRSLSSLGRIIDGLEPEERLALLDVMLKGGLVPLEEFVGKHGDDLEESPDWNWHRPKTAMGRLKARGLIAEGSHEGREWTLILYELRHLLQAIQRETKTPN